MAQLVPCVVPGLLMPTPDLVASLLLSALLHRIIGRLGYHVRQGTPHSQLYKMLSRVLLYGVRLLVPH